MWDFDGTLGYRVGGWAAALLEILRYEALDSTTTADQLRPHLQVGFPWHTPGQIRAAKLTADQWWDNLDVVFEQAFASVGIGANRARQLAKSVRDVYPNPRLWRLFGDAIPAMETLSAHGWTHVLLSNSIPELRSVADSLHLSSHLVEIFNSAETGYEKPHPHAFRNVLSALGNPGIVWMMGDNMIADVAGAEAVGIPAILVRKHNENARYYCDGLSELQSILD